MKYYMLRLYTVKAANGTVSDKSAVYTYEDKTAALKQYYRTLSVDIDDAAKPTALCMVVDEDGIVHGSQMFRHEDETNAENS